MSAASKRELEAFLECGIPSHRLGVWSSWDDRGRPSSIESYNAAGKRHGTWKRWAVSGADNDVHFLYEVTEYRDDKPVSGVEYDRDGTVKRRW